MNIIFLATDAYGGHGGIAYYNRCLSEALAGLADVGKVTLLPRSIKEVTSNIPAKVQFISEAAGGKRQYLQAVGHQLKGSCDLIICGHINLLPLAAAYSLVKRAPLVLQVHGIEVWRPPERIHRTCLSRVSSVWSVSAVTRDRMNAWAKLPANRYTVIPNTIHPERYGMAPRRADLEARYGVDGKKVILTLARLDARERYKGIDEILQVLPRLLESEPQLIYMIAGDGDDRGRLFEKAREIGVENQVIFTGYVPESDKADLLRLADVFAMPGRGEGFGIVYLEAMACGIPVVGSLLDGSRDALQNGALGPLVNPNDLASLEAGMLQALKHPKNIPDGLANFAWPSFMQKVSRAVGEFFREELGRA